jgi:hypothetical protein
LGIGPTTKRVADKIGSFDKTGMLVAAIIAMRIDLLKNFLAGLLLGGGLCMAQAQTDTNYTIDWFKVAGGGGTSSNGQYSISGTIGQYDAGVQMSSDSYSLTGGFWSIYALQTPGAPILTVTSVSNTVVVSWTSFATNYVLVQNLNLATTNWVLSDYPITTNGDTVSITITSPPPGNLFFRLKD